MQIREQIMRQLRAVTLHRVSERVAGYAEADIWDLVPAARGLTVLMADGCVLPLPIGQGSAKQLLHSWTVEAHLEGAKG